MVAGYLDDGQRSSSRVRDHRNASDIEYVDLGHKYTGAEFRRLSGRAVALFDANLGEPVRRCSGCMPIDIQHAADGVSTLPETRCTDFGGPPWLSSRSARRRRLVPRPCRRLRARSSRKVRVMKCSVLIEPGDNDPSTGKVLKNCDPAHPGNVHRLAKNLSPKRRGARFAVSSTFSTATYERELP